MLPFLEKRKTPIIAIALVLIAIIYFTCAQAIGTVWHPTILDYFTFFADALVHGRLNIAHPADVYDLSLYQGKWYLNWGPGSVLYVLPFYLFMGGLNSSDILYTLIAGIANVFLFFFCLRKLEKVFSLKLSVIAELFLIVSFAFASPNLYLSLSGHVWFSEEIIATFYSLISFLFLFQYLDKHRSWQLALSVVFFNLAWMTRYTLIFTGIVFLYVLIQEFKRHPEQREGYILRSSSFRLIKLIRVIRSIPSSLKIKNFKLKIGFFKSFLIIASISLLGLATVLTYNFVRFHNPFETGLTYHNGNGRFETQIRTHQFFSISNVLYNANYYFLHVPKPSRHFPFAKFDLEGNSVLVLYPALLFLPLFFFKKINPSFSPDARLFLLFIGIAVGLSVILLLLYFATGWTQFGARYFLDFLPISYFALAFIIDIVPWQALSLGALYEILINLSGTYWFYHTHT